MAEYVRVRDKETGHHLSILRSQLGRRSDAYAELKQDATYADGTPLPPKHKTSVSSEAAKKQPSGQQAETKKEN
jgi:hypothetical protein